MLRRTARRAAALIGVCLATVLFVRAWDSQRGRPLELEFPPGVFSLSHIALPFPIDDGLYGLEPDPAEDLGIRLGSLGLRGEQGALIVGLDTLLRMSSDPFFSYQLERIDETVDTPEGAAR